MKQGRLRRPTLCLVKALASNIRSLRQAMGLSQEELAARCGLHRTYIGSIERAERNVTLSTLEALAAGLGVVVQELLMTNEISNLPQSRD